MNYGGIILQGSKWGMNSVIFKKNTIINFKGNNDIQAVAGFVVVTDTYTKSEKNPGMKKIVFTKNIFSKNTSKKKGTFVGAFVAVPSTATKEIQFQNNIFSHKEDIVVSVELFQD